MAGRKTVLQAMAARQREPGPTSTIDTTASWRLGQDGSGNAWLVFDRQGESSNAITEAGLEELDRLLGRCEGLTPKGLAIRSAKPSGFAVGADVDGFRGADDPTEVGRRMARAHAIVERIERLPFPTVAVIHGHCLGGGLELALACRYRIAVADARLGFPEVLLGLHPGLGGTARATRLIDPIRAMRLMLTGASIDAARARRLGLVDAVVEERHVAAAVNAAISGRLKRHRRGWSAGLKGTSLARGRIADAMRKATAARVEPEHYPAPFALIDLWRRHGGDHEAMLQGEIESFSSLVTSEPAQTLIGVFFLRERLKALAKGEAAVGHVHVVGGGTMGGDIAAWCAAGGLRVSLADLNPEVLAAAMGRAERLFTRRLGNGRAARDARDRLIPDFTGDGAACADLVIEAVPEDAEIKRRVFAALEQKLKPDAILASNTSSIPLDELARGLARPERFLGLHFFNPVDRMLLVEVVRHDRADPAVLARAQAFCGLIDRLPAPVASAPGFLVNRVLTPYLLEAVLLLDEGVAAEAIDRAATDFGMAMGPVEVADRVGLDVCLHVAEVLRQGVAQPMPEIPGWLKAKVERGELGRKSGKGLYDWAQGRPRRNKHPAAADPAVADRLILPLLNACVACLREGVVEDAELIDAGVVFATGFAPFRGGPLTYARRRGVADVVAALERLGGEHGARFTPDAGWRDLDEVR
jgi:3-hydroxyacyl-CoA dehydrogenase / enoyl-CoA hydratase / 3-hydroxybutyryl-CoA epimerase